jgi:hypothetical protein
LVVHNLNPNRYRYRRSVSGDGGSKSLSIKHGEDGGNKSTKNGIDPDFDSDLDPDETY